MSIAVLNQVYDEMRRLAIAGSSLASDDFRLKKLIPPLEQSGAKVPVFAKVAQAIQKVIDPATENAADALLELSTLVTAVLYTQGETGVPGSLQEVATQNFDLPTSTASARVLKPLVEALTTTGSGRVEIIRDAHERGAFKDLRLVKLAVGAIDDVYGEIGEFIADQVLPTYGKAIYSDLRNTIDVKGKGGHVRRLRVMHRLDPAATHEVVEQALESGSPEMKVAAMECLKGSKDHISYLLGQTSAKSKDVRRAALEGISEFDSEEVFETLKKALSGADVDLAVGPTSRSRSAKLLHFVLEEGQRQLDELLAAQAKAKLNPQLSRFLTFLSCFTSRTDKNADAFLVASFRRRDELQTLKGNQSGQDIVRRIAGLLVGNNSKAGQKLLVDARDTLEPNLLTLAMLAAARTKKPKDVYDSFSPYFLAQPAKKKRSDPAGEKREVVRSVIHRLAKGDRGHYYGRHGYFGEYGDDLNYGKLVEEITLDPRWLDAAVAIKDVETVIALARPKHKGTVSVLKEAMDAGLNASGGNFDNKLASVLDTMNRIDHPDTVECYLAALEKAGKATGNRYYYAYWLLRLIPDLPKKAAPKIEALLPSLNEKVIDEVIPYLEQLKAK
jgi:hypothetical protein